MPTRRLIVLGLAAAMALPAAAAHRITVQQLEQDLAVSAAEHRSDADIARQIGAMELSERLTSTTLDRLAAKLPLQPRTAVALQLLADQSAFLDPPAAEIPATEPPDAATQQRILALARGYVVETVPRLPNFFATRTVHRFDDSPQVLHPGDWPVRAGLHLVGSDTRTVAYRDGKEVVDTASDTTANTPPELGLYSFGEFGPVLARTFTDLVNGHIEFSHWEQTSAGLAAVYRYQVPRAASHYQVHFCCLVNQEYVARQAIGDRNVGRRASESNNPAQTVTLQPFDATPAYHGTLSIDPATGAILRITLEAELNSGDPIERAATVVDYGPVQIGEQRFICPVRSLALSVQQPPYAPNGKAPLPPTLRINENTFTHYHRLGSTARMIADGSVPPGQSPEGTPEAATPTAIAAQPSDQSAPQATSQPAAAASPASAVAQPTQQIAEAPPAPAPPPPPAPPAEPVVPEISMTAAKGLPDTPASAPQPQETGFSLKMTSRLVDVGVVALDKKGRPVTDLKPEDFEIYDNGRKQDIRFFTPPPAAAPQEASAPATPQVVPASFSNRAVQETASVTPIAQPAAGGTVLLLDESHIAWDDLNFARAQMLKFIGTLSPNDRVGLYTMTATGFRVLVEITADHAALAARLKNFMPSAQSLQEAQEEERRNRQQFDYVHNVADLNSVNGNHLDVPDSTQPVDPELMTMGSNPARSSFIILAQVARHLSAIPGHKSLVWVSSDNVLADWQDQTAGPDKGPREIHAYAIRAQEAMNEAHSSVYPFDVSQLEAGGIGANMQNSSVQLAPAVQDNLATAAAAGGGSGGTVNGTQPTARQTGTGRIDAQMSQDLHPIQGPVRDVAAATGGRVFRRAGDLAAELTGIVDDGRATYQLSFSPQGQADDQYHAITVKLTSRHGGVTLRYRTGYLFAKEPVTLKDRFQHAVWQPMDVSEIGVSASVSPSGGGSSVKINIAANDLGMEQHAGRWMDKLDIFFIQRDDAGIHAHVEGQTLGLRLKPATYQNILPGGVPFERAVEMQPGMASLRVLVVDENSGRMGSVTIPATAVAKASP